jgi:hypothetical protein
MDVPCGCAQGHVQDRALLRDIDLVAREHGVDPFPQARFLGQPDEELEVSSVMRFFE